MDNYENKNWVEKYVTLLDSQFKIPGTNIRFGIDPILSLIPGLGTFSGLILGLLLVVVSNKYNVSAQTKAKMVRNIIFDFLFGLIPILGSVKDVFYKSNEKNLKLIDENLKGQKHNGEVMDVVKSTITTSIIIFVLFSLVILVVSIFTLYKIIQFI